jgi:hypothetical protein
VLLSTTKPLIHHISNISEVVALIASRCSALLEAEEIDNTIEDRGNRQHDRGQRRGEGDQARPAYVQLPKFQICQ